MVTNREGGVKKFENLVYVHCESPLKKYAVRFWSQLIVLVFLLFQKWIQFLNKTEKNGLFILEGVSFIAQLVSQMIVWWVKRILIAHTATVRRLAKS